MEMTNRLFKLVAIFFMILPLASLATAKLSSIEFNFPRFNTPENDGTVNVANAKAMPGDGINALFNMNNTLRAGWVVYQEKIQLWDKSSGVVASFSTNFTFNITAFNASVGGSGLAFLLAPEFSVGEVRGYLGIFSQLNDGNATNHKIAVEFDVFRNLAWADPSSSHVGININSIKSKVIRDYCPVNDPSCTYFVNRGDINVWIDYIADNLTLEVRVAEGASSVRPIEPILQYKGLYLPEITNEYMVVGFSASTGSDYQPAHTFRLSRWHFNTIVPASKNKMGNAIIIGVCVGIAICILIVGIILFAMRKRLKNCGQSESYDDPYADLDLGVFANGPRRFTYKELNTATKGFSKDEVIGGGGFGKVFKGVLKESGTMIAVKKISEDSKQGEKEFIAEVSIISKIRHRNLVQLQGWCHERGKLILVYDYMPNGSLDQLIYCNPEQGTLGWHLRYKIITNVASALAYLHEEWDECVVHRDVKASNVMLDKDFNGRLGDFGLARLVAHNKMAETTMLAGTLGYMAPELSFTHKATTKSDVFSFGALTLEVICGRRPFDTSVYEVEYRNPILLEWVWDSHEQNDILNVVDPRLNNLFNSEEAKIALSVGLMCSHPDPAQRPNMQLVRQILTGDAQLIPLPTRKPSMPYCTPTNSQPGSNNTTGVHSAFNSEKGSTSGFYSVFNSTSGSNWDVTRCDITDVAPR